MHLLKAIRIVSRLESSSLRQSVFSDIAGRSPVIRLAVAVYGLARFLRLSHWLAAMYGFSWYVRTGLPKETPRWLAVGVLPNEIKHLNDLDALMPEAIPARVRWGFANPFPIRITDTLRLLRVLKLACRGLSFMPACRVAETILLYARFHGWLAQHKVRAVIVTSDYSPDACALAAAAGSLGIPRIYMPHALMSIVEHGRSPLDFDLYIFDSLAMRDRFAELRPLTAPIVLRGVRGISRALQSDWLNRAHLRFGIFLSGLTDMAVLRQTITALKRFAPERILLRGHPVAFANPDFMSLAQQFPEVKISRSTTLLEDADACDLVIGGNTTSFLEVLKHGVPAAYLAALDHQPHDYNGFVRDRLVPVIISPEKLNLENIKTFFAPSWPQRMAYFDAAYGQNPAALQQQVREVVFSIIETRNTVCIIQARMGSTRLPGKVMMNLARPVLWHVIERVRAAASATGEIVVATSTLPQDNIIEEHCKKWSIPCFRGDENDVLKRYYDAATAHHADRIIRITADCPLLDPELLKNMLTRWDTLKPTPDYMCNTRISNTFPKGLDIEIFTSEALGRCVREAHDPYEHEHVTPYFYRHPELFRIEDYAGSIDLSNHRWTLDTKEDYAFISMIYDKLYKPGKIFTTQQILMVVNR